MVIALPAEMVFGALNVVLPSRIGTLEVEVAVIVGPIYHRMVGA